MKKTIYLFDNRSNRRLEKKYLNSKKGRKIKIILIVLPVHAVIAVLDMPTGIGNRGIQAKKISLAAASSTYVTVPAGDITALNTLINTYNNANTADRVDAWRELHNALKDLMALFQTAANALPAKAISIIQSGGFKVKKEANRKPQKFEAKDGADEGEIILTAEGGGAYTAHDWMYSPDGIKFERMIPTIAATTSITGLVSGDYAYFVHQLITKKGGQGFSQIIKIRVK